MRLHHLKLQNSLLTIFNVYRPPESSPFSSTPAVFLQEFTTLLSIAATTPHEFILTGDFNIHVDDPSDSFACEFLTLLSSTNLTQHVNPPTHYKDHTLDLVITSSLSNLSPGISFSFGRPPDHYPVFTLLDKHAPIITKSGSHSNNPWYTSYLQAFKSFRRRLERTYKRTSDPQLLSELKSATNRYHHLLATAKKKFYSSLVYSRSSNPRHLWKTINQLLHRKSSNLLPNSLPPSSIAESLCSFFSGKISTLRLSLQSLSSKATIDTPPDIPSTTDDSPPSPPPASLSTF